MEPQQATEDGGQAGASPGGNTTAADAANMVGAADTNAAPDARMQSAGQTPAPATMTAGLGFMANNASTPGAHAAPAMDGAAEVSTMAPQAHSTPERVALSGGASLVEMALPGYTARQPPMNNANLASGDLFTPAQGGIPAQARSGVRAVPASSTMMARSARGRAGPLRPLVGLTLMEVPVPLTQYQQVAADAAAYQRLVAQGLAGGALAHPRGSTMHQPPPQPQFSQQRLGPQWAPDTIASSPTPTSSSLLGSSSASRPTNATTTTSAAPFRSSGAGGASGASSNVNYVPVPTAGFDATSTPQFVNPFANAQYCVPQQAPAPAQSAQQNEQLRYAEMIMNSNMSTADKLVILTALQPTSTTNANANGATISSIPPAVHTTHSNARAAQGSVQGVRPSAHLSDAQIEERFRRCSTTPFKDAFKKKDGSAITFNGSVAAHPAFLQRIQAAFDDILGIFVPELLTYNYTFREAPQYIKMKMYPYVIGCATGSAKPWAELARKLQPVDANGNAGWYDNLFDQYIAYLDSRFDDKNMHKQGEKQLLADVLKVKYSDGTRSVPFDARIEKFFSLLFTKLRDYAEVKGINTTAAYMEQQMHDHAFQQMPRFMAEHISVLTMPNDVELVIEQIRPKLRQQYNFAQAKDMPLTDKEHAGPSNVQVTSKQYNAQRFGKRDGTRRRPFLNVDLRTKTLSRGACWWCKNNEHNLYECAQAKAIADENTRKGKNFDDSNREVVRKFKAENEWKEATHDRGHGHSQPCRHCGEPRHDGKSCRDAKGKQSAFQNSKVDEEQMREALKEEMRQEMRAVLKAEAELAVQSANSVSQPGLQFKPKEPATKLNPYQTHGAGAADQ